MDVRLQSSLRLAPSFASWKVGWARVILYDVNSQMSSAWSRLDCGQCLVPHSVHMLKLSTYITKQSPTPMDSLGSLAMRLSRAIEDASDPGTSVTVLKSHEDA